MGLHHIILPKPAAGKSTALSRLGMVAYWAGAIWVLGNAVFWLVAMSAPGSWGQWPGWPFMGAVAFVTAVVGVLGFFIGRALLFILANR